MSQAIVNYEVRGYDMDMDNGKPDAEDTFPVMTMGTVLRRKQDIQDAIFATRVAFGDTPTEACKVAFEKEIEEQELTAGQIYKKAFSLKNKKRIKELIACYKDEIETYCHVHPAEWIREVRERINNAAKAGNHAAVMRGLELLGKQAGLFSETMIMKRDQQELTEEQCEEQIRALVAEDPELRQLILDAGHGDVIDGKFKTLPAPEGSNQKESQVLPADHPA